MMNTKSIPMSRPNPPRLSEYLRELEALEHSGIFTNFGPMVQRLERNLSENLFRGGGCLSICNATLGLMIAIRQGLLRRPAVGRRFALMPSFTFAATAHAALWNGLTPLFCDIDPDTWLPSADSEIALLEEFGNEIAVMLPCTTFGNNLDLAHYDRLHAKYGVEMIVDAAASLGSIDTMGRPFGEGSQWPIVFSMHATKPFSSGEGGIIYCADEDRLAQLKAMSCFGFEQPRVATLPGLNAKMSEVAALSACLRLEDFENVVQHRDALSALYRSYLPGWQTQRTEGQRQCHNYHSVLLPDELAGSRAAIVAVLKERGIGTGAYFNPHLAKQPYFAVESVSGPLPVTEEICARIITLPMYDQMTAAEVKYVAQSVLEVAQGIAHIAPDKVLWKQQTLETWNSQVVTPAISL
jgi:dTDP-4-amino-4,6-dideoxygalactose transaminase